MTVCRVGGEFRGRLRRRLTDRRSNEIFGSFALGVCRVHEVRMRGELTESPTRHRNSNTHGEVMSNSTKKVVVLRRNGLGDFIAGTVPLCNYMMSIGSYDFSFFVSVGNFKIVRYFFPNSHVFCIPSGNKYIKTIGMALKNRGICPDIGISPMPEYPKLNNLFLYLIGARDRHAIVTRNILTRWTINHPFEWTDSGARTSNHVGLTNLRLLDPAISTISEQFYPRIDPQRLGKQLPSREVPCILVEVSNNRPTSQMSNDKTADILNAAAAHFPFSVLISAKEKDVGRAEDLKSRLNMSSEVFSTKEFDEYISFVNSVDIVLVGDGGLGHIAGALGKRVVALYGETPLEMWRILSTKAVHFFDPVNVENIRDDDIVAELCRQLKSHRDCA